MKWNLHGLKFLLGHIEGFIDTEAQQIQDRARSFSSQTGLDQVQALIEPASEASQAIHVFDRLTPFYDVGLLLQDWQVTDIFWRGSMFHLDAEERRSATKLVDDLNPEQVRRAPADKILRSLEMDFLLPGDQAAGFLFKPTPQLSFVLLSTLATPWLEEHVRHTQRLINKAFVF